MKAKSNFFTILGCSMIVAAATAGLLFVHYGAKDIAYEQYKAHNNCPYEGLECPNALIIHQEDSIQIEYLEGQLSLYHEKYGPLSGHEPLVKGDEQ